MRKIFALIGLSLAIACGDTQSPSVFDVPEHRIDTSSLTMSATERETTIFARDLDDAGNWEPLFSFKFTKDTLPDIFARWADGVKGTGVWAPGDRIAYHTAYLFFSHADPGHHDYLNGARIVIQNYGDAIQVNDKYMQELFPQGKAPYPYEKSATIPVDKSMPGGTLEIWHQRVGCRYDQLLADYEIPAVSPNNPKVKWYYQLGGLFVAVHDDKGPIARIIVTAMHPRYTLRINGHGLQVGGLATPADGSKWDQRVDPDVWQRFAGCGMSDGGSADSVDMGS